MKPGNTYEIYYDEEADFLEVFFGSPSESATEEVKEGIFIRKDKKTKEVKSIAILSFKRRGSQIPNRILSQFNKRLPIQISV